MPFAAGQINLFSELVDPNVPYQPGSVTSKDAADSVRSEVLTQRGRVYAWLLFAGSRGGTDEEIATALDMNPSSVRPRRIELVAECRVFDSGKTRDTKSGRKATVWRTR